MDEEEGTNNRISRESGKPSASTASAVAAASRVSISQLVNGHSNNVGVDHTMVEAAETLGTLREEAGKNDFSDVGAAAAGGGQFMQRVQAIPLVNSALGMYDRSRQSSAIIRVGSDVIESGVRKMYQPLAKRIDVAQLDSFACRQLDNLGYTAGQGNNLRKRTKDQADEQISVEDEHDDDNGKSRYVANGSESQLAPLLPPRPQPQTQPHPQPQTQSQQPGSGARWRVVDLVASARERALAYREDSLRRLKYCLDWVVYATALVNQHIQELRRLLGILQQAARTAFTDADASASLDVVGPLDGSEHSRAAQNIHEAAVRLSRARKEIVAAVRKAVGVVSHYAGSVLPGEARRQVRALVLGLPRRLGAADPSMMMGNGQSGSSVGSPSVASSCNSPFASPRQGPTRAAPDMSPANIEATTRRTLTFASESFVMLDALRNVFSNLYTNAERWIGVPTDPQQPQQQPQTSQQQHQTTYQQQHEHEHLHSYNQQQTLPQEPGRMPDPVPADHSMQGSREDPMRRYRDPTHASTSVSSSSNVALPGVVRRPPRRLPLNMTPMASGAEPQNDRSSMLEIGEQMRLMDMAHKAKHVRHTSSSAASFSGSMDVDGGRSTTRHSRQHSNASFVDPGFGYASPRYGPVAAHHVEDDHHVAHKRNRTREPTPTRT
ncbi:transcriptional regulator opi1 [Coemansia sp. IMI 203386]|nr:transcriptional regulator opi1 [Coemansia sp. IMI 203386]